MFSLIGGMNNVLTYLSLQDLEGQIQPQIRRDPQPAYGQVLPSRSDSTSTSLILEVMRAHTRKWSCEDSDGSLVPFPRGEREKQAIVFAFPLLGNSHRMSCITLFPIIHTIAGLSSSPYYLEFFLYPPMTVA